MGLKRLLFPLILATLFLFVYPYLFIFKTPAFAATDLTSTWSSTSGLPATIASSVADTINGKLYFFGGANVGDFSQILIPTIGSGGAILGWNNASNSLPQTRYWGSLVQKDNRVYILGGASLSASGIYVDTVYSSTIQPDGTLSVWQAFTPLLQRLGLGAGAIVGDRIYFAGGFNNSVTSQKVYSAPINSDGSLGDWIDAGNLPAPLEGFSMIEHNGHLIIIGGNGSSAVYKTTPDASGHILGWDSTTSFPTVIYRASAIKVGTTLLVIGGHDGSITTNNIYFTTIHDDGTLDPWTLSSNHLPSPVHGGSAALVGQYLYLMGGYNGGYLSSVYFTKLNIEVSPTPTPTPSPTPTPIGINLQVPLIKQIDSPWAPQLYDTANIWAPLDPRINSWGCALTSAAMIFNYHGITKLPDGTILNPGTLNAWMKAQVDGYVNGGWVNWLALTRLSKLSKPKNPAFLFDALEYKRIGGYNPLKLTQDLEQNIPGILEVPGHFIVGKGTVGTTDFSINDPYYSRSLLSDYSNSFIALGEFIPSHTNLSYMMFVVDSGIALIVKDVNGNAIGEGFAQQPIDQDGGTGKNGDTKIFYYIPVPVDGSYTLTAVSPVTKKYKLQTFLYDKNGNVKMGEVSGTIGSNKSDSFTIHFDSSNKDNSKITQNVSFESLLADLDLLFSQKLINPGIYTTMKAEVLFAKKLNVKSKVSAKAVLLAISIELNVARGKSVTEDAYQILKPEVVALRESL